MPPVTILSVSSSTSILILTSDWLSPQAAVTSDWLSPPAATVVASDFLAGSTELMVFESSLVALMMSALEILASVSAVLTSTVSAIISESEASSPTSFSAKCSFWRWSSFWSPVPAASTPAAYMPALAASICRCLLDSSMAFKKFSFTIFHPSPSSSLASHFALSCSTPAFLFL